MKLAPKRMFVLSKHSSVEAIEVADNVMAIDYTMDKRRWGHDFTLTKVDGHVVHAMGWGLGVEEKDLIVFGTRKGTSLYRVRKVEYERNPRDMWSLTADWVSREEIEHIEKVEGGVFDDATLGRPETTMTAELNNYLLSQGT